MKVAVPHPATAGRRFHAAIGGVLYSPVYVAAAVILTAAVYTLYTLTTFPQYSWQLLSANPVYITQAVSTLTTGMYASIGVHGVLLVAAYSGLTAVAILHVIIQFRTGGLAPSLSGAGGTSGVLPVFLVGGCAGCGAGLLGLFGAAGALAVLPFNGNGIRLVSVVFLVGLLGYAGDPRTCDFDR